MSYSRTEYHRESDRDNNQDGGWRSWFGLGSSNKDRDDQGYSYSRTTTYRDADNQPRGQYSGYSGNVDRPSWSSSQQYGDRDRSFAYSGQVGGMSGQISGQYGGGSRGCDMRLDADRCPVSERGGYGYQTTGERYQGQQPYGQQYGQQSGQYDRDNNRDGSYYRAETRTYGGDREYPRYGGESQRYGGDLNVRSSYGQDRSPSRGFGFSGDYSSSRGGYGGNVEYQRPGQQGDYSYRQSTNYSGDRDRSYGDSSRYGGQGYSASTSYRY